MDKKKLSNGELKKISAGYTQDFEPAFSYGEEIICPNPNCRNADQSFFICDCDALAEVQKDLYTCTKCGRQFAAATGYGITDILN